VKTHIYERESEESLPVVKQASRNAAVFVPRSLRTLEALKRAIGHPPAKSRVSFTGHGTAGALS
ncbi:MAG: hypothetical protein J6V84_00395, partial [Clostridia bacterium]|nr:hypothetical protein [Clostridia bacterium]